jgi:hypothetical protein
MTKKSKLISIHKLKKQLDALWSKKVRDRDKKCLMCGSTKNLQAHHYLKSKARSIKYRWDTRNGITLCFTCHLYKVHTESSFERIAYLLNVSQINYNISAQESNEIIYDRDTKDYSKDRAFLEAVSIELEK